MGNEHKGVPLDRLVLDVIMAARSVVPLFPVQIFIGFGKGIESCVHSCSWKVMVFEHE